VGLATEGEGETREAEGDGPPGEPPQAASRGPAQHTQTAMMMHAGRLKIFMTAPFVACAPEQLHHRPADVYRMTIEGESVRAGGSPGRRS